MRSNNAINPVAKKYFGEMKTALTEVIVSGYDECFLTKCRKIDRIARQFMLTVNETKIKENAVNEYEAIVVLFKQASEALEEIPRQIELPAAEKDQILHFSLCMRERSTTLGDDSMDILDALDI